jgi:alpha-galactosidase
LYFYSVIEHSKTINNFSLQRPPLDTLLLGNYGLSYDQSKAQLAIWAVIAAPFLLSTDLRTIKPEIKELLLNREIIAVNQDPMGIQGKRVTTGSRIDIWTRPVTPVIGDEYSFAVAFTSRRTDGHGHPFNYTLADLNLSNKYGYEVKDLFDAKRATFRVQLSGYVEERVNPTGANFYKFTPLKMNS